MTNKPKSKGRVTYYAARSVGLCQYDAAKSTAHSDDEHMMEFLRNRIANHNAKNPETPLELVRVEVTPV